MERKAGFEKTNGFSPLEILDDKKKIFWWCKCTLGVGSTREPWGWVGAKSTLGVGSARAPWG